MSSLHVTGKIRTKSRGGRLALGRVYNEPMRERNAAVESPDNAVLDAAGFTSFATLEEGVRF